MTKQNNNRPLAELAIENLAQTEILHETTENKKKPFIEPVVSVPVDVLEATAFFQIPTLDTSDS